MAKNILSLQKMQSIAARPCTVSIFFSVSYFRGRA